MKSEKLKIITLSLAIMVSAVLRAQEDSTYVISHTIETVEGDTLQVKKQIDRFLEKRFVQSTYIGVPLVAAGLIEMGENKHFRQLRTDFLPSYKNEWENSIQYAPLAVVLALKACGVEGKNPWNKMITAGATSALLNLSITHSIKRVAKEERPDGSAQNSFPSGHTATAFMTATMLAKEYGHLSPWVSIGGYSAATATGVMRMVNNRHWMSDVLAGAGIGIMCTEFGYWLTDALFPNTKKNYDRNALMLTDPDSNPSFFGIYAGFFVPLKNHKVNGKLRSSTGGTTGTEGAFFWNRHWGVGGQLGFSDINYIANTEKEIIGSSHFWTTLTGIYFSHNIHERLSVKAKALSGSVFFPKQDKELNITNPRKMGFCYTSGLSLCLQTHQHLDFKLGCDYQMMHSSNNDEPHFFHTLLLTGGTTIRF